MMSAPCPRRLSRLRARWSATSGAVVSRADVGHQRLASGRSQVIMPIRPTRMPAASTMADGRTFGHSTRLAGAASRMFAARNGKRARAAAALSAPCRSAGVGAGCRPRRTRSRGCRWPARCSPSRCRRPRPRRPRTGSTRARHRRRGGLERVAGVQHQHGAAVGRARRAQVLDVAAEHGQPAAALVGCDAPVQIVGADDGDRDALGRGGARIQASAIRPRDERGPEQCRGSLAPHDTQDTRPSTKVESGSGEFVTRPTLKVTRPQQPIDHGSVIGCRTRRAASAAARASGRWRGAAASCRRESRARAADPAAPAGWR